MNQFEKYMRWIRTAHTTKHVKRVLALPEHYRERLEDLEDAVFRASQGIMPSAIRYSADKIHNENPVTMEDKICRKADLERKYQEVYRQYKSICWELMDRIAACCTEQQARAAKLTWLDGMSVRRASEEMRKSERHVWRLRGDVIRNLTKTRD